MTTTGVHRRGPRLRPLRNLLEFLYADKVDPGELLELFSSHFKRAEGDQRGGWLFPSSADTHLHVQIVDDRIRAIRGMPAFDQSEADFLRSRIEAELVRDAGKQIQTTILFTHVPVDGQYHAPREAFRILPAPPRAPRPPYALGHHPFLLQFPVTASADTLTTMHRSWQRASEWMWLLSVLLAQKVFEPGRSRHLWAIVSDGQAEPRQFEPRWVQEFYAIPDWQLPASYGDSDAPPLVQIPSRDFYRRVGIRAGEPLTIPDSFSADIESFLGLSPDHRGQFLRAAQWKAAAANVWESHISSWYMALVAAIEALTISDETPDPCPTCDRDRNHRPTKNFKDFLTRYAPGSGTRTELDVLYGVRSALAHGSGTLRHDSPMGGGLLAFGGHEREAMDRLSAAVSLAMVNWLRDPTG
jgi:hypothetical protein